MGKLRRSSTSPPGYDGRIAVVTGASSGIGRRLAVELAGRGATVIGVARRAELLADLERQLQRTSPRSTTVVCDVGDVDAYQEVLRDTEASYDRIDVLINNAGTEAPTPVDAGFDDTYRHIFDVNFFAVAAGTLAVLPGMTARRDGIVVNVSSDTARAPEPEEAAYAASKAAIAAFTEAVAHEVAGRGVRVHVLYPAWVPTAMGMAGIGERMPMPPKPVRRTEEQIAALVLSRMGGPKMEINAALLPQLAPIGRTVAPLAYQRSMRSRFESHRPTP